MNSSTWLDELPNELFYTHLSGLRSNDLLLFRRVSRAYDTYAQTKTFLDQDAAAIALQKKLLGQWISNPESMKISAELVLNRLDHPDYDFYARLTAILLLMKKQNRSFEVSQEKIEGIIQAIEGGKTTECHAYIRAWTLLSVFAPDLSEAQLASVLPSMIADGCRMSREKSYRFECTWSALAWRMSTKQLADAISFMQSNVSHHFSALTTLVIQLNQLQIDAMFASEMNRLKNKGKDKELLNPCFVLRALLHRLSKEQIAILLAQVEKIIRDHQEDIPYQTTGLLGDLSPFLTGEQVAPMFTLMQEKLASNRECGLYMMEALASRLNVDQIFVLLAPLKEALCVYDVNMDLTIRKIVDLLMSRMNPLQYSEIWMELIKNIDHNHYLVRKKSFELLAKHSPYQREQVVVTLEKLTKMLDSELHDIDILEAREALFTLASQLTNEQITVLLAIGLNRLKCDGNASSNNGFAMLDTCAAAPALDDNQIIIILNAMKSSLGNKEHVSARHEKFYLIFTLKLLAARLNTEQIADVFPLLIASLNDKDDWNDGRCALEVLNILAHRLYDDQVKQVVSAIGAHALKEVYEEKANLLSRLVLLGKCDTTLLQAANIASMAGGDWICFFAERFAALQQAPDQQLTNLTATHSM